MSSTEPHHAAGVRRSPPASIPPIAGLFEQCLDTARRAYQRRGPVLARQDATLLALRPIDQRLDQLAQSARYYGATAIDAARLAYRDVDTQERAAAAFCWLVCTLEQGAPVDTVFSLLDQIDPAHHTAIRDALWFFPRMVRTDLLQALLASADEEFVLLGVELAGLLTQRSLSNTVLGLATRPSLHAEVLLASVRTGTPAANVQTVIEDYLRLNDSAARCHALQATAVLGRQLAVTEVQKIAASRAEDPAQRQARDLAFNLLAVWQPKQILAEMLNAKLNDAETVLRVVALTGYVEGLLWVCKQIEAQAAPPTQAQLDVLQAIVGEVPMALRVKPGDASERAAALVKLVHAFLARAGCSDLRPADLANWTPEVLQGHAWPVADVRFRAGQPWRVGTVTACAADISHALRAWFYTELAYAHQRPTALHAHDFAPRQLLAIEAVALVDELAHS